MLYLKISNHGSFNRKYLELIGLSSKRQLLDDNSIIGFKGSGTKLAAVAALRLGLKVSIASSDYLGRYVLTYDLEEVDIDGRKVKQIFFNYDPYGSRDGREYPLRYPSQMTIDAFADWDEPIGDDGKVAFKVLREFVCNAADSGEYEFSLVKEPVGAEPGCTAVYLLYTDQIRSIFDKPERYFKFIYDKKPVKPLYADPNVGEIYPRSDRGKTRLFVLGVLVDCTAYSWRSSLFDYSLFRKTLISEERVIKSFHEFTAELGRLFSALTDVNLAAQILLGVSQRHGMIEEMALNSVKKVPDAARRVWLQAARGVFGPKIAISSGVQQTDSDAQQVYGYTVIGQGNLALAHFLRLLGVPDAKSIVPAEVAVDEYAAVRFDDLDESSRARFNLAFGLFARHFPDLARLPLALFHPKSERLRAWAGFAGSGSGCFKEIWIATASPTELGTVGSILGTLVHEARHCATKTGDYDRAFIGRADDDIVRVILREAGIGESAPGQPLPPPGDPVRIKPNFIVPKPGRVIPPESAGR